MLLKERVGKGFFFFKNKLPSLSIRTAVGPCMPRDGVPQRRWGDKGVGRNSQDQLPFSPRAQRPSWGVRVAALSWVPWASGQGVVGRGPRSHGHGETPA